VSQTTNLGAGAEFDAIRRMLARWGNAAVGIGDDAATIALPRGDSLVVSVDSAVEGQHFKRTWLSPREISYRAVVAAASDLAAMAARPLGLLIAMTVPVSWRDHLDELADGMGEAARVAGTVIRGGNLSDGAELSINTTVLGAAFAPIARSGARAGDAVYVTGRLGAPAAAIRALESNRSPGEFRERFARPVARIREAIWLAERGITAAIDISDGLVADLGHLAAASGVGIDVDAARIPLFDGVDVDLAVSSGEEYELIVTASQALDEREFSRRFDLLLTRIGVVTNRANGGVEVQHASVARARGHDHFSG